MWTVFDMDPFNQIFATIKSSFEKIEMHVQIYLLKCINGFSY